MVNSGVGILLALLFFESTIQSATYIEGASGYNYCASNDTSDPCLYYLCNTDICLSCQTLDLTYLVAIDSNTTVCAVVISSTTESSALSCSITNNYYIGEDYYGTESFLNYLTYTQENYCVDQDYYYNNSAGVDVCGDTAIYIESTNVIEESLDYISIGCDMCSVTGYMIHDLVDIYYYQDFYIDTGTTTIDFSTYSEYGQFYIRNCVAGNQTSACSRTEYYDTTSASCQLCACQWSYCLYCTASACLLYDTSLSSSTSYSSLVTYSCTADPCVSYETGTDNCQDCPDYDCTYNSTSGAYSCIRYGYLLIDSNTTICAYAYEYTDGQTYCYVGNDHYSLETYFGASYNATASSQSIVYCEACDYYSVNSTNSAYTCSDSCANSAPATSTEEFIDEYSIGCGVCATGYEYQQLTTLSFLDNIYVKTCADPTDYGSCSIIEYYDPHYNECFRCACKFTNCAACTYDACILESNTTIDASNCTYEDPCLSKDAGTNNCNECIGTTVQITSTLDGKTYNYTYKLMIIDSNTTICSTFGPATNFGIDSTRYICAVDDYYYQNETYYGNQYYASGINNYCIACDYYFNDTTTGKSICSDGCENVGTSQGYLERSVTSYTVGCGTCNTTNYQMQTVSAVTNIDGLYIQTCDANIQGVYCSLTQYYDSTTKACVSCSSVYSNCAACNSTQCLICADEFYYSSSSLYNYSTNTFTTTTQCSFQSCPSGQGIIANQSQTCAACGISNCHSCALNSSDTSQVLCSVCDVGYFLNYAETGCTAKSTTQQVKTYYVSSGATYNTSTSSLSSYYNWSNGSSPSSPYYFIQTALYNISQLSINYSSIDATIYLGKGDHFFFFCDAFQQNGNNLTEYCDNENYVDFSLRFLKAQLYTDNITLSVKALECSLSSTLGLTSTAFYSMCVSTGSKPTVYLNQAYAYFTLYGSSSFYNIKFSGINQFAAAASSSSYQLSTLPILYCQPGNDPTPTNRSLTMTAQTIYNFPLSFSCDDTTSAEQNIPSSISSTAACERNDDDQYYSSQESTLATTGEPDKSNFFYQGDSFVEINSGVAPKRRNTLFNIQAFAEYQSTTKAVPSLNITNCDFEYFLNSYDSLINIDNAQISNVTVSQVYNGDSYALLSEDWEFFVYNGGERGAKITIANSTFQHSKFTKGMLVYRKQPYIEDTLGFVNLTYLYMSSAFVVDTGSYITISDSYFYNLNFLSNVTALAIYGGSEVMETFHNYLGTTDVEYQVFMHKGIVLNVEDYGGTIEVKDSEFTANMHFIPEILITNHTKSIRKDVADFKDTALTKEYKMAYCAPGFLTDRFFFQNGISQSDDMDAYYDTFERLSLLYISRNRGPIIVRDSNFTQNMGTFGGALSINSMNKQQSSTQALVAIYNNTFAQNMAYFSGNAIYIRMTKNSSNMNDTCGGGVLVKSNLFNSNIGMKAHNGGALSASCAIIDHTHQDYNYSSSLAIADLTTLSTAFHSVSSLIDDHTFYVPLYQLSIYSNEFDNNYAGHKGTAVYLKYISYSKISTCNFIQNGPVFSFYERSYSPYYTYFSSRTITYYDPNQICYNELAFLTECNTKNNYIDFSHIQGAVYVEHCQESQCMNSSYTAMLEISLTKFQNNQAGPILDKYFPNDLASQIYIAGGFSNQLTQLQFVDSSGIFFAYYKGNYSQELVDYFPPNYFYAQQIPLVTIEVDPDAEDTDQLNNFYTNITTCNFKNNKHYQVLGLSTSQQYAGSLINYISQYGVTTDNYIPTLTIQYSSFSDNQIIGPFASLIHVYNGILKFISNSAINNGKIWSTVKTQPSPTFMTNTPFKNYSIALTQMYGVIKIQGDQELPTNTYHYIYNNQFFYSFSEFGSVFSFFLENQYAQLASNTYQYNFASKQGSIVYGEGTTDQSLIFMEKEKISYQFSYNGTIGITSYNSKRMSLIINNTQFSQIYSSQGSAINLYKAQKVKINYCVFENFASINLVEIVQAEFYQYQNPLSYFIDTSTYDQLITETSQQGSIYIEDVDGSDQNSFQGLLTQTDIDQYASFVEVYNCGFANLYAYAASIFYVTASNLKYHNDENSEYGIYFCSQNSSGAIYMEKSSEFVGQNLVIVGTTSSSTASVLHLNTNSRATIFNSEFSNNMAAGQALAIVEGSSSFNCTFCLFDSNYGGDASILFADNNPEGSIDISNSIFTNNTSNNNLFLVIFTQVTLTDSILNNNIAYSYQNGYTLISSKLSLDNVTVNYDNYEYLQPNGTQVGGGFISASQQSDILIKNSYFQNVKGGTTGVLYATDGSTVKIEGNTTFSNCSSADGGSVVSLDSAGQVNISSSHFLNSGQIDIKVSNGNATIHKSRFINGNKQSVYGDSANVELIENTFSNSSNTNLNGKGIFCNCDNLTAIGNTFQNLSGVQGGAIYLTSPSKVNVFHLHDNIFSQNQAQQGGAVYIQDSSTGTIFNNSFLENNANVITPVTQGSSSLTAKGQGGAIFFNCFNLDSELDGNCSVQIQQGNKFISNRAEHDGGAIQWTKNDFSDEDGENPNLFSDNKALYGSDVGSYPSQLSIEFVSNNDYYDPVTADSYRRLVGDSYTRRELTDYGFSKIVAGVPFQFLIYLVDNGGNYYTSDNSSVATLSVTYDGSPVTVDNSIAIANNGVYNFSSAVVYSAPGSTLYMSIDIAGIEDYGNTISFVQTPIEIPMALRTCVSGEQVSDNSACTICPNGTYSYYSEDDGLSECLQCDDNALCFGANSTAPQAGYWRVNSTSGTYVQCPRVESCLAGNESNPTGVCATGYSGPFCAQCDVDYTRVSNFGCQQCPNKARSVIQIIFIFLFVLFFTLYLIRSTMNSSKSSTLFQISLRIMINHFQIIGAISLIDYNWPHQIQGFYDAQVKISQVSNQLFSYDCFLQGTQYADIVGIYYSKLILYAILPIIVLMVSFIFWSTYSILKRNFVYLRLYFINTAIILLFLLLPTIATAMFSGLSCIELDGVYYLRDDTSVECYKGTHILYLFAIIIPSILVWIIGLPFVSVLFLIQNREVIQSYEGRTGALGDKERMQLHQVKVKYGFLINGYKLDFFFWEILLMYKKIFIIMVAIFLAEYSQECQVLVVFIILILSIIYQVYYQPYNKVKMNRLEVYSQVVIMITMYCGLFFITGQHYSYMEETGLKWFFLICVVIPNIIYYGYWIFLVSIEIFVIVYTKHRALFRLLTCRLINEKRFYQYIYGPSPKKEKGEGFTSQRLKEEQFNGNSQETVQHSTVREQVKEDSKLIMQMNLDQDDLNQKSQEKKTHRKMFNKFMQQNNLIGDIGSFDVNLSNSKSDNGKAHIIERIKRYEIEQSDRLLVTKEAKIMRTQQKHPKKEKEMDMLNEDWLKVELQQELEEGEEYPTKSNANDQSDDVSTDKDEITKKLTALANIDVSTDKDEITKKVTRLQPLDESTDQDVITRKLTALVEGKIYEEYKESKSNNKSKNKRSSGKNKAEGGKSQEEDNSEPSVWVYEDGQENRKLEVDHKKRKILSILRNVEDDNSLLDRKDDY